MGVKFLSVSVVCTFLSIVGLQCWTEVSVEKYKSDSLSVNDLINSENASSALELLLGSYTTLVLVASFALNLFISVTLGLKILFFSELSSSELRKLLERLVNYIIYKGTFLPLVVPPTIFQAGLWSTWLTLLCFLKMFQAIARDRLERLNASPSATPGTYFRVYSALLLVFILDVLWSRNNSRNNEYFSHVPPGFRFHPTDEELVHDYYPRRKSYAELEQKSKMNGTFSATKIRKIQLERVRIEPLQQGFGRQLDETRRFIRSKT